MTLVTKVTPSVWYKLLLVPMLKLLSVGRVAERALHSTHTGRGWL